MKRKPHQTNARREFALQPLCPNCGQRGRHYVPAFFPGDSSGFICEPEHRRMGFDIPTSGGVVQASIKGDPNMPESTRNALLEMMRLAAEDAMKAQPEKV